MTFRKSLHVSAAVTVSALLLVMGGCSPKDKGQSAQISVEAAPLGLTAPNEKVFARHFDVPQRQVTEADATAALKVLNLEKEGVMTWDKRSGGEGNYIYTDLGAKTDEGTIMIGKAELVGVHMDGDEATFDRINFQDMVIQGEDVNLDIAAMSIARPSPKMAQAIMKALQTNEGLDDLEFSIDEDEVGSFGAISLNNITVKADEASGTIEQIVWGVDSETSVGDGKIGKINFLIKGENDLVSTLTFEGGSARGVNTQAYGDFSSNDANMGLGQLLGQMNLYAKPYDSFQMGKGAFTNDYVNATFEGFEGKAVETGGVTTITQVGKPMRLAFLKQPSDANAQRGYDTLKQLGFDELVFKTSQTQVLDKNQDTVAVRDGLFDMENGFRLNYTYEAEGLSAMVEKAKADQRAGNTMASNPNMSDVIDSFSPVKLRTMKMSLEDKSIVERSLKLASEMTGQSETSLKKQLKIATIGASLFAPSELEGAIISELGEAFSDFIDNGGTLTVSLSPPTPLSVKTLAEARENNLNPKDIGFSASVKKPASTED